MPCRFSTGNLLQQRDRQTGSPRCRIHPRTPCRPSRQTAYPPRNTITAFFLRRMGYQPSAGQENAPNPARKVPRRYLKQKKVSFPAQNGIPPACRAEKRPKSCAEGAPEAFGAEKGIFSCAEWDTNRLPGRKMPHIRRGRCPVGIWSRKSGQNLRGTGYLPPAASRANTKKRGRSQTSLLKLLAYLKLSLYDSTHWASVSASTAISTHVSVNFVNVAC